MDSPWLSNLAFCIYSFFVVFFLLFVITYFSYIHFMLQILSPVLEMIPCSFGIRLAALASRKELIDLEKWLSTNLSTYKDTLFEVKYNIGIFSSLSLGLKSTSSVCYQHLMPACLFLILTFQDKA